MTKIDWKSKLTSRKFWAAIIGFITTLLTAFNISSLTIEQVVAIIGAVGTLIAYILAEGYVDGKRESGDVYINGYSVNDTENDNENI